MIRVGEWLASRTPAPPKELSSRLHDLAGSETCDDYDAVAELLLDRAVALLENLCDDRTGAFDLLAADALITYAMEAAAENHRTFDDVSRKAAAIVAGRGSQGARK